MDKENMVYPNDGILFSNKKEYYNIDEPWKYYTKWKKPVTKDHTLYDSIYMKCRE